MIRIARGMARARSILCSVLLLTLALSSIEVLWAEGAEVIPPLALRTAPATGSESQAPTPAEDDCPCLCACACPNVQAVVVADASGQEVTALTSVRAPTVPWPGPSHLFPEPLLPPPRS